MNRSQTKKLGPPQSVALSVRSLVDINSLLYLKLGSSADFWTNKEEFRRPLSICFGVGRYACSDEGVAQAELPRHPLSHALRKTHVVDKGLNLSEETRWQVAGEANRLPFRTISSRGDQRNL